MTDAFGPRVVIVQYRLLHYRLQLFESLRERLAQRGVELLLVHGQASATEKLRRDEGRLDWALPVHNRFLRLAGKDLVWQPLPRAARAADLCIVMQENRILSNYVLQLQRRRRLFAFWGHGRNFQSSAPTGWRERWKGWWLRRADWWFAYTGSSVRHVVAQGFAAERVTNLENAIDGSGFAADLAAVPPVRLAETQRLFGITPASAVAIYCGSLYADKRIGVLLESAELLRARLPDFHLVVVGDGPEAARVREAAKTRPWLHPVGPCKGADKALHFRLAALMLNPGLVGLHVVDAFVAATPLVTQASAPHSPEYDYLVDGVNGVVVHGDSAAAYAEAVARLFETPARLEAMRERCAEAASRYTLQNMVERFADGIVRCLQHHGLGPSQ